MSLKPLLTKHEGRKNRLYLDTKGIQTIGIGHNCQAKPLPADIHQFLDENGYITDEMIDRLFDQDVEDAITDCESLYPGFHSFTKTRQDALIDFIFNVGRTTALTFVNTNRAINEDRWDDAANGLLASKYARQVGRRANDIAEMLRRG